MTYIHIKRNTNYYRYLYIQNVCQKMSLKIGVMVQSSVEPHLSPKLGLFRASKELARQESPDIRLFLYTSSVRQR